MNNSQFLTDNCIITKQKKGDFISKENAAFLQGIAVLFMVFHHLFAFPDRVHVPYTMVLDFSFFHFSTLLSYFGSICMGMFAFVSGYGMVKVATIKLKNKKNLILGGYALVFQQMKKFYLRFWIVFFIFVSLGFILGVYQFDWLVFFKSLVGINTTYNGEWWYVLEYIRFLLVFPVLFWIVSLINKLSKMWRYGIYLIFTGLLVVVVFSPVASKVLNVLPAFIFGMIIYELEIFENLFILMKRIGVFRYIISLTGIMLIVLERFFSPFGNNLDFIVVPFFCFFVLIIAKNRIVYRLANYPIVFIGKYSIYIWLTHTFFAYYYFQSFTYSPYFSVLIFLWCLGLTLCVGIVLEKCFCFILGLFKKKKMELGES